ncbi:YcaO-like family protein [Streptomyces sp. NPDC048636]|uniref:YcaO-like family protein n=1 Tax=Streptomyces sp. NPDC048636 TaxID=3155762 RepID=UPI003442F964
MDAAPPDLALPARRDALAEAAERSAGFDVLEEERIWATAEELRGECLEPDRYPRCSEAEYGHPQARVVPFDPTAKIRWQRGLDLVSRCPVWVPSVMACYGLTDNVPAEKFSHQVSTGYALHTDPVVAALRGLCEVIERDAVSVVWLQRLPVPALDPALLGGNAAEMVEALRERFPRVHLFDATSDVGVPTVYSLFGAEHDTTARIGVAAGCGLTLAQAAEQAVHEAMSVHGVAHWDADEAMPGSLAETQGLGDTTRYLAQPHHASAFDFLLAGAGDLRPPRRAPLPRDPGEALDVIVDRLAGAGMRPVVVDRTPRELRGVGLTAISAVVPDLQPMGVDPLAQFKGHRRLYEAPRRMGYRSVPEAELNPLPQPFS